MHPVNQKAQRRGKWRCLTNSQDSGRPRTGRAGRAYPAAPTIPHRRLKCGGSAGATHHCSREQREGPHLARPSPPVRYSSVLIWWKDGLSRASRAKSSLRESKLNPRLNLLSRATTVLQKQSSARRLGPCLDLFFGILAERWRRNMPNSQNFPAVIYLPSTSQRIHLAGKPVENAFCGRTGRKDVSRQE